MNEGADQRRISYRLLFTTLWATLLLLAVEAIGGWASHSLTLLAESLHTLIDGFSTVLSLVAVTSPQRQMGREVWGHGRAEVAATLVICAFLGFTGISLLFIALGQIVQALGGGANAFPVSLDAPVLRFTAMMVIVNVALGVYASYQARSLNSLALKLNTQHFLADAWLSLVMVVVLIAIWQNQAWLDPTFALLLLPLVARSLWRVLNEQLPMLLRPTAIAPEAIAHLVTQVEGVTHCRRIRSRGMVGRQVWVELHLVLHPELMEAADQIEAQVEALLRKQYGPLRAQVWVEPARRQETYLPPDPVDYLPPSEGGWG
ncbi:MAG TPA: cation diffusion facilitator family transporter [Leptolyngbyaceae cyanobacterium M65_K2018_010]|nr:cation diffusion facilitator family transporter [Leptolyngbyaceae cyanobacterium M65_K2018_010]